MPLTCLQRRHYLSVLPGLGANPGGRNGRYRSEVTLSMPRFPRFRRRRNALRLALALAQCLNGSE
jgi:hypothetical protein